ncbi:MAG: metallophosphoesterase family protein [Chlorobi bacterium]|nr:metallophosphoesterase family protein [Chlorobiota bacterium]
MIRTTALFFIFILIFPFAHHAQTLISRGSTWKYHDRGVDLGTAWRQVSYDDSSWPSGPAQLGFGDGDEATVLQSGHITYYFRKTFTLNGAPSQNGLAVELLRDDGAVIYINGTEVVRSNMPQGTVTYNTLAASTVAGSEEDTYFSYVIPSSYLVQGTNVVAVEVHQRSASSSDISFDLSLSLTDLGAHVFRKRPYLIYPGTSDAMTVLWQLPASGTCTFRYGTDTTYAGGTLTVNEYGTDHQFRVDLSSLTPDTRYFYRVECNGGFYEGSFRSGASATATSFTFYAYGDTRTQPWEHDGVAAQILNRLTADPDSQTFLINSGDLVEDGDLETDWDEQLFSANYPNINRMMASLPYLAAVGNHEGSGRLFAKYFPYPMFAGIPDAYYSFDYGNVHFVVIDQYADYSVGSAQYNWLVNDLASTGKPWRIAIFHKPGWSAGGHGNDSDVQNILQPLFRQYHVAMAITGHNHYYARADVNGIQHITTGGGGAPLYYPSSTYPYIVRTDRSYHFLQVRVVDNRTMEVSAIRQNGTLIERFTVMNPNAALTASQADKYHVAAVPGRILIYAPVGGTPYAVYDLTGRLIRKGVLEKGQNRVAIPRTGIYLVQITPPQGRPFGRKVVVP